MDTGSNCFPFRTPDLPQGAFANTAGSRNRIVSSAEHQVATVENYMGTE